MPQQRTALTPQDVVITLQAATVELLEVIHRMLVQLVTLQILVTGYVLVPLVVVLVLVAALVLVEVHPVILVLSAQVSQMAVAVVRAANVPQIAALMCPEAPKERNSVLALIHAP